MSSKKNKKRDKPKTNTKQKFSQIHKTKFALASGIVVALIVFLSTIFGVYGLFGGFPGWNDLIRDIYGSLGYSISLTGALIGAAYSFIDAFIVTWILGFIYNKLLE